MAPYRLRPLAGYSTDRFSRVKFERVPRTSVAKHNAGTGSEECEQGFSRLSQENSLDLGSVRGSHGTPNNANTFRCNLRSAALRNGNHRAHSHHDSY